MAGLSEFHFARLVKAATGDSPFQFVTRTRMERVKQLLCKTRLPIFEIAERVILLALIFQFLSGFKETFNLAAALTSGRFISLQNLSIVAAQASINTVLAAGMNFVILTGGIDLSVGSILAASSMLGLIVSLVPNYSFLGFKACLFTWLILGLTNGALIAFLRLPPFIVTLGSLTEHTLHIRQCAFCFGSYVITGKPDFDLR